MIELTTDYVIYLIMVDAWGAFREACLSGCFVLAATVLLGLNCLGQNPIPAAQPGIQDNSFLVEEAYNQNFGVVQHISSFTRFWNSKDWNYTFTQDTGEIAPSSFDLPGGDFQLKLALGVGIIHGADGHWFAGNQQRTATDNHLAQQRLPAF